VIVRPVFVETGVWVLLLEKKAISRL
jgi:hypothetical protein